MYLVNILLPANTNMRDYNALRKRLIAKFGGLTAFSRAPAEGLWKARGKTRARVQRDEVIVIEVMTPRIERTWWKKLRLNLEEILGEEEIVVRYHDITRL
jgi:hypothetical protein